MEFQSTVTVDSNYMNLKFVGATITPKARRCICEWLNFDLLLHYELLWIRANEHLPALRHARLWK